MKRTIFVTGASRGIGAEIARMFAQNGHRVVIHGNGHFAQAQALSDDLAKKHFSVVAVRGDVTSENDVCRMVDEVHARFGAIDVLINNAGVALPQQLLTDCTLQEWNRVFDVNVKGSFLMTRAVLPDMIAKKAGSVINISSMWGVTGGSCEVPYSASKAALIGMTRALAKEVAPSNVRVNCVAPGFVKTDMNMALTAETVEGIIEETPLLRAGMPMDIAHAVLFLAGEDASFITGQVLCVDGGCCI